MAINRSAEAMTIFAVMMAALFPRHSHGAYMDGVLGFPTYQINSDRYG